MPAWPSPLAKGHSPVCAGGTKQIKAHTGTRRISSRRITWAPRSLHRTPDTERAAAVRNSAGGERHKGQAGPWHSVFAARAARALAWGKPDAHARPPSCVPAGRTCAGAARQRARQDHPPPVHPSHLLAVHGDDAERVLRDAPLHVGGRQAQRPRGQRRAQGQGGGRAGGRTPAHVPTTLGLHALMQLVGHRRGRVHRQVGAHSAHPHARLAVHLELVGEGRHRRPWGGGGEEGQIP